jgi:hypothetical protein
MHSTGAYPLALIFVVESSRIFLGQTETHNEHPLHISSFINTLVNLNSPFPIDFLGINYLNKSIIFIILLPL